MWQFRLIELLTYYSWRFIDIRHHCLDNFKLKTNICIAVRASRDYDAGIYFNIIKTHVSCNL
jgi:hypothetical protein